MKKSFLTLLVLGLFSIASINGCAAQPANFGNFTTQTIEGKQISQEVFAQADLTMINIWATFCGPCLQEMPELGEIAAAYSGKGVQLLGIIADADNQNGDIDLEQVDLAKEIISKTQANYVHLLPSPELNAIKLSKVNAVPETIFVDKTGKILGKPYVGSRSKDAWLNH
ncbi:MAG: TlpA disulfide reductase family protein [Acidaminococcaceae bacterium]